MVKKLTLLSGTYIPPEYSLVNDKKIKYATFVSAQIVSAGVPTVAVPLFLVHLFQD